MEWNRFSKKNSVALLRQHAELRDGTLALAGVILLVFGVYRISAPPTAASQTGAPPPESSIITSLPFEEMNGDDVYNASGVIPLADSRFLFCDNNGNDALFELDLTPDGKKKGVLIKRPLTGLAAGAIDDLEAMTIAGKGRRRIIFATSSLYAKKPKNETSPKVQPSGLLRVKIQSDNRLFAENMPGFRDWFVRQSPYLTASATLIPDEGGLNVEGLAWDHKHDTLLFGLRTPLSDGKALIIPVRVKKLAGSWTTRNLKMLPPIRLSLDAAEGEQGIRDIQYIPARNAFLVIAGKTTSNSKAPYSLYEWDGNQDGKTRRLNVSFAPKMKPEGITSGTVGGKPVLLFVDDAGGYQVVWTASKPF